MNTLASNWNVVRLAQVPPTPWRNGGGSTRELLAWPVQGQDWQVRLSVAEVAQDGPFSSFPGVRRWFAVLSGAGVRLALDGAVHRLDTDSAPFGFDGAAAVDCTLPDGPTQDFNLMLQGAHGTMRRLRGSLSTVLNTPVLIAIYVQGTGGLATFSNETVEIGPQTLAWRIAEGGGPLEASSDDALCMEVAL